MAKDKRDVLWEQLLDIGQQMNETRALEPLLVYALDISIEFLGALYGFLVLVDDDGQLEFPVARDQMGNDVEDPELQVSNTIIYRVVSEKHYLITASAVTDDKFSDAESVSVLNLKSVLCVPLISLGSVIGVIYLENRRESDLFEEKDARPLMYLAGHAAVCIQNAMMAQELDTLRRERIDELSDTDEVTKAAREAIDRVMEEERTRLLYGFIQDTSHQFRTPLSVIKTSVDLLKRKVDPAIAGNYLERIREQVNTIVQLVDSLNLLAKLEAKSERVMTEENLTYVVHDMWEVMAARAMVKNIEITEHYPDNAVNVPLMRDYARQAIGKVLQNAIQYTGEGGSISIMVGETDEAGYVIIEDTGIGISAEDLPHVKKRFHQVDKSGTMRGLGLGLAIADSIMNAHGGQLHIESELGTGTAVTLVFPEQKGDAK